MYSGVAGLKNHQTRMDVIGNNIANVNTVGFKKSRVVFKDSLYQSIRGASSPTDSRGGTNPMAIGLGMTISSIDQIHNPAPTTITNKTTDMAIDGSGYFILSDGGNKYYSRAGAFDFDKLGSLVSTSNGYRVLGWMADTSGNIDTTGEAGSIDISGFSTTPPRATESMQFTGNLASTLNVPQISGVDIDPTQGDEHPDSANSVITSKEVYDSLGNRITVYFRFFKTEIDSGPPVINNWACDISLNPDFENATGYDPLTDFELVDISTGAVPANPLSFIRANNLQFDEGGNIVDSDNAQISITIDRSAEGAEPLVMEIDFASLTQYNADSSAQAKYQDGYSMGSLSSYNIGIDGTIQGVYDNGQVMNIARVALANFQNPAGLIQVGSNLFQESNNSGDCVVGAPGNAGMGAIIPGSLEMSNVDLSEEFTDMIVTQRGFQANSRIITTSDEMLQELVNLKR
jgi:flagellar hook protein FlgE